MGKPKKAKNLKGKGAVSVLVLLLLSSAGLRIATSASAVFAETNAEKSEVTDERENANSLSSSTSEDELSTLLKAFQEREERIRKRELEIERRMAALQLADEKIVLRLSELKAAETQLRETLALSSTAAESDLARLTAVYENMKPKVASALFEEMDPDFAAGFIGRMKPGSAASIMAGMNPQSAYTISTILAGRNALAPTE